MFRVITRLAFYMALLVVSMMANVYLHELGHYAVADAFGLTPDVHFMGYGDLKEVAFSTQGMSLAYVRYTSAGALQDLLIALAGPLVNIGISVALAVLYVCTPLKEKFSVKFAYFMLLVPALMAVISNLIPMAGTDGYLALKALSALF